MIMAVLECKKILHYPRLDTVIMVEEAIKKYDGEYSRTELWNKLEKKMMYQTYKIIMDYLIKSRKVIIKDDKVVWIFNPSLMDKLMENSVEV
jgi:hypothetical protein